MSLTSASTIVDADNQYKDNLRWRGDITKALNALEAVEFIIECRPDQLSTSERSIKFDTANWGEAYKDLRRFVDRAGPNVNRAPFTAGRMNT